MTEEEKEERWEELKVWIRQQFIWPEQKVGITIKKEALGTLEKMAQLEKKYREG